MNKSDIIMPSLSKAYVNSSSWNQMWFDTSVLLRIMHWDAWVEQFLSNVLSNDFLKLCMQWKSREMFYPYAGINISPDQMALGFSVAVVPEARYLWCFSIPFLKSWAKLPPAIQLLLVCNTDSQERHTGNNMRPLKHSMN